MNRPEAGARRTARWQRVGALVAVLGAAGLWAGLDVHRRTPRHHGLGHIVMAATGSEVLGFSALAAATLVAMGPCVLQMGLILVAFWCGIPPFRLDAATRRRAFRPALGFLAGYLAAFAPAASLLVASAGRLPGMEPWLQGAAGLLLLGSGILLVRPASSRGRCAGPSQLLVEYGAWRPPALGAAYAFYCSTCCGPYLVALGLLLATGALGTAAAVGGLILVLAMAVPVLVPLFLDSQPLQRLLARSGGRLRLAASSFSIFVGIYLALSVAGTLGPAGP